MVTVIPAILEQSLDDIHAKVERIKPHTDIAQLDVMDGQFVPNTTWNEPGRVSEIDMDLELHLMINHPELFIPQWAAPNVKRMIIHFEAVSNLEHAITQIRNTGAEVGVALNPETSTFEIQDMLDQIDLVLIMGVEPGFSGQKFHRDVLEKIKEIKSARPDVIVEVDGGVNGYTRKDIVAAGTDILAAASYIWNGDDIAKSMDILANGMPDQV